MDKLGYCCSNCFTTGTVIATSPIEENLKTNKCGVCISRFAIQFFFPYKTGFNKGLLYIFICLYTFIYFFPCSISCNNSSTAVERSFCCCKRISSFFPQAERCSSV